MLQPRYPTTVPVERGFLRLPHGDVHYRACGEGPVVLALHESPRSSLSLLPVIEALCPHYRVIAMDTPGYGLSEPLPGETPSMDDFLDAIVAVLDSLGLGKVALYGAHTGAALALSFAVREPDRVTALVLDGLSAFTATEVEDFRTRYLTPYEPAWDGAHVMRLWSRVKDLYTWFPWYEQTSERRLSREPADVGPLHRSALGFVQAGVHYAKAYILAASYQPNRVMGALKMPATVIARPDDLIAHHLDRLTPGPAWEVQWLDETAEAWKAAILRGLGRGETPDRAAAAPRSTEGSAFLPVGAGWLHVVLSGPADGPLRIMLAGLPGSPSALAAREVRSDPGGRLAVLSLPGCGRSDPLAAPEEGLAGVLAALDAALAHLGGIVPDRLGGEGASAVVADLWAARHGWDLRVERLDPPAWLSDPALLPSRPLLTRTPPSWDGSHLTSIWFQLRDLELYAVPPGAGAPVRRPDRDAVDVSRLDRLFAYCIEGPDCADVLQQVLDHLRLQASTADGRE